MKKKNPACEKKTLVTDGESLWTLASPVFGWLPLWLMDAAASVSICFDQALLEMIWQ